MATRLTLWIQSLRSRANRFTSQTTDAVSDLRTAREALLQCVHDCSENGVRHLQQRIQRARTHRELWLLRSDVYHCVAMQHHQATATERVQSLAHHFEGWVDPAEVGPKPL